MKVLITGAGGQVGQALQRTAPANAQLLGVTHATLDIADEDAVLRFVKRERPQVIINSAAYTAVDRAEDEPDKAASVNADGARHLALAARETGARLVHISTDFVFDGAGGIPYAPDAPVNPLGVYGATKLAGEQAVTVVCPDQSAIVRTAWVYSAHGANFVRTMLRLMAQDKPVRVVADQIGTPTAANSLAQALWQFASRAELCGVHHYTDSGVASWYDFAVAIAEEGTRLGLLGREPQVVPIATHEFPTRARRPNYSVLDKSLTFAALNITPPHWRENLRAVLKEMKHG